MAQHEKTVEGVTRYYQTRERAMKRISRWQGQHRREALVDLLVGFALDERKHAEVEKLQADVVNAEFHETKVVEGNCYEKAKAAGEPTFTLRAQDRTGAMLVGEWIKWNISTAPLEKLKGALDIMRKMQDWPAKKQAD